MKKLIAVTVAILLLTHSPADAIYKRWGIGAEKCSWFKPSRSAEVDKLKAYGLETYIGGYITGMNQAAQSRMGATTGFRHHQGPTTATARGPDVEILPVSPGIGHREFAVRSADADRRGRPGGKKRTVISTFWAAPAQ
jgi:hypothetical protein